ncbi:hypothetical protein [Halalkalibacterium ligniniphilum]|uniref:hypothetical protein n=1 Tax=Halalkalibacterium ligniniphilum TaxID=1134413 RepID=UPI00047597DE|nr:hypothetical protein [Halalkalibacterium ligniniphilum]
MKKNKLAVLGLAVGLLAFGGAVQAGTSYSYYNTTVGKFNGSGYTGYQTKASSGTYGHLDSRSVGGSYVVDARMQASSGTGSWVRNVTDNDFRSLPNSVPAGTSARVQFSNDLDTPVDVQVTGYWRSN